tara:strand:- start:83 stop:1942 length:1860 start_codon:yes stop_codon:yes gene_type:complete
MAENVNIVIKAFDKFEGVFAGARKGLAKIGMAAEKVKKRFPALTKAIGGMATLAKKAFKAVVIVVTAVATAMTALTVSSLRSGDQLAKTADKIGMTTEALAGLRHAAELTGVSAGTMDMAMQRLTRRVSEAANGTGEAVGALHELGINASELEQLPLDEQMNVIADSMAKVKSQSDKVRLAMKLFDSEGVALVNTLAGGSEGLAKMAAEANVLGLALSRADTAQIEAANDSITRAKAVFTGLGNQLAVAFAPIIETVANLFRQSAVDSAEFGNVGQRVADGLVTAFAKVQGALHSMSIFAKQVHLVFYQLAVFIGKELVDSVRPFIELYDILAKKIGKPLIGDGIKSFFDEAMLGVKELQSEIELMRQSNPAEGILAAYEEIKLASRETAEVVAANSPAVILAAEGAKVIKQESFQDKIKKKAAIDLAKFNALTQVEQTQQIVGELGKQFSASSRHSKKLFAVNKAFQIGQAIMNTYAGASKALAAYPPPINFLMAAGVVTAGLAQVAQIRSQSFEGGGFTGGGSRTGGVDGKGGFPAILHPNETVIDHTKNNNGLSSNQNGNGSSVIVNQTINVTTGIQSTVRAEIVQLMPQIAQAAKGAVADARLRGGNFSKAMGGA